MKTVRPVPADFTIIIEYPSSGANVVNGRGINVYLAEDDEEKQITTCGALSVHADAAGIAWAEAELWADENDQPIFSGQPYIEGQQIKTKIFNCNVQEIRSARSFTLGYNYAYQYLTGKLPPPRPPLRMRNRKAVAT